MLLKILLTIILEQDEHEKSSATEAEKEPKKAINDNDFNERTYNADTVAIEDIDEFNKSSESETQKRTDRSCCY